MAASKKVISTVAAVATSAALLLGGTLAWQSTNQTALNEASDIVNPGGRLHDDFDGENCDVYVENFAEEEIFARVRLDEYLEIVMNYGTAAEKSDAVLGSKNDADGSGTIEYTEYDYVPHIFTEAELNDGGVDPDDGTVWWNWEVGGETTFMPTFNKNKDSLAADVNGEYILAVGGISDRDGTQYENYTVYAENDEKTGYAIYDADLDTLDEIENDYTTVYDKLRDIVENGDASDSYNAEDISVSEETHVAKSTQSASLISMAEWEAKGLTKETYDAAVDGNYWVYDTDGWLYWSAPIPAGEATGLILDEISLKGVMDDTWYYAINVIGQFVTADDLGKTDGTGFYDTSVEGISEPSDAALALLETIGVDTTGEVPEEAESPVFLIEHPWSVVLGRDFRGGDKIEAAQNTDVNVYTTELGGTWSMTHNSTTHTYEGDITDSWEDDGTWFGDAGVVYTYYHILLPEDAAAGDEIYITYTDTEGNDWTITVTVTEGETAESPTFTVGDMTNTAVLGYDLTTGARVNAYVGTTVKVSSTDLSSTWNISDGRTGTYEEDTVNNMSTYTFDIGADEVVGTEFIVTQTGTDGNDYSITIVVSNIPTVSIEIDAYGAYDHKVSISGIEEEDFPIMVKAYVLDAEDGECTEDTLSNTITFTRTGSGIEYEQTARSGVSSQHELTYENNTITFGYNDAIANQYLAMIAEDSSGNVSEKTVELVQDNPGCFAAGTQVLTESGLKNIEDIQLGEMVWSVNTESGEAELQPVVYVQDERYTEETYTIYAGGEEIVTTYEHPFYVDGEWVAAENLKAGDMLTAMDGSKVAVDKVVHTVLDTPLRVYNFTVDGYHNYVISAAKLMVHNIQK